MKQYKGIVPEEKVKNPVVSGTKFPDVLNDVLGDRFGKSRTVSLKQFDVVDDLLMLDSRIFTSGAPLEQIVKKIPKLRLAILCLIKFDFIYIKFSFSGRN